MVLEKLSESLKRTLKKIAGSVLVDKKLIEELVKEIQKALLSADVNVELVFELTKKIKERALNEKLPKGLDQRTHIVNIVYEELVKFLGGKKVPVKIGKKKPFKIMMIGTYGSGKTTSIGKLGLYYSKRGYKVATLGLDVHRPAAVEQIEQISEKAKVKCFADKKEKDALKIYKKFKDKFSKYDLLIVDTAGRDALTKELIKEIKNLNKLIKPDEKLLVVSADIGQASKDLAVKFHESCGVTGVIATKMDGTARAGGALSACAVSGAPIKFLGVGEKLDDLEEFNPKGFAGRLLGMGDLEALLEKAKEAISEEQAQDLGKKFLKGDFNFLDLYEQLQAMSKMGPITKLLDMIPGMGNIKIPKEMLEVQGDKLKKWKHIMRSCTKKELEDPELITGNRIERIAKGSGSSIGEVKELLKQYKMSKKMMKKMKGKGMEKMMKKFGGMM